MTTNGQLNDTCGYHIKQTNSTCNMNSCFRLKGPCASVCGNFFSAQPNFNYCRKGFDQFKTRKMYAKICVALGVCISIEDDLVRDSFPKVSIYSEVPLKVKRPPRDRQWFV